MNTRGFLFFYQSFYQGFPEINTRRVPIPFEEETGGKESLCVCPLGWATRREGRGEDEREKERVRSRRCVFWSDYNRWTQMVDGQERRRRGKRTAATGDSRWKMDELSSRPLFK